MRVVDAVMAVVVVVVSISSESLLARPLDLLPKMTFSPSNDVQNCYRRSLTLVSHHRHRSFNRVHSEAAQGTGRAGQGQVAGGR